MSFRKPLITLAAGVALVILAVALDAGGERSRDLALVIGAAAFYLVLPVAVIWLIAVLIVRARSGR